MVWVVVIFLLIFLLLRLLLSLIVVAVVVAFFVFAVAVDELMLALPVSVLLLRSCRCRRQMSVAWLLLLLFSVEGVTVAAALVSSMLIQ